MGFIPTVKLAGKIQEFGSGSLLRQSAAQKALDEASGYVSSLSGLQNALTEFAETSAKSKDAFVKAAAKNGVDKMLGTGTSLAGEQEALLKKLLDPKFKNYEELFERIRYSFIPTTFPSGEKFILPRLDKNNIIKAAQKWDVPIGKQGDAVTGIVAKKALSGGEECFMSGITRHLGKGASESSAIRFYPKSGEISLIHVNPDKLKTIKRILGTEDGGKIIQEASFHLK